MILLRSVSSNSGACKRISFTCSSDGIVTNEVLRNFFDFFLKHQNFMEMNKFIISFVEPNRLLHFKPILLKQSSHICYVPLVEVFVCTPNPKIQCMIFFETILDFSPSSIWLITFVSNENMKTRNSLMKREFVNHLFLTWLSNPDTK